MTDTFIHCKKCKEKYEIADDFNKTEPRVRHPFWGILGRKSKCPKCENFNFIAITNRVYDFGYTITSSQ